MFYPIKPILNLDGSLIVHWFGTMYLVPTYSCGLVTIVKYMAIQVV